MKLPHAEAGGAGQAVSPPRQYHVVDEGVIRRHVGISQDPAIMPSQLRHMADRAEREESLTVRVIPFTAGAHPGLSGPFTLLEFDGSLPDLLYLDAGRDVSLITGSDPRIGAVRGRLRGPAGNRAARRRVDRTHQAGGRGHVLIR